MHELPYLPSVQNKYIHRRDSVSLAALSAVDKEKLARIGVVTEVQC